MGYVPPRPRSVPVMGASIPAMIDLYENGRLTRDEMRRLRQCDFDTSDPPSMWNGFTVFMAIVGLCCFSFGVGRWVGQMQGLQIAKAMQTLEKPE